MLPATNLTPTAPQAKIFCGKLNDSGGNGTIFNPHIADPGVATNNDAKGGFFQKASSFGFGHRQLRDNIGIGNKDKLPGVTPFRGGRPQKSFCQNIQFFRFNRALVEIADTATLAQQIDKHPSPSIKNSDIFKYFNTLTGGCQKDKKTWCDPNTYKPGNTFRGAPTICSDAPRTAQPETTGGHDLCQGNDGLVSEKVC
jgi:hypothetical protein